MCRSRSKHKNSNQQTPNSTGLCPGRARSPTGHTHKQKQRSRNNKHSTQSENKYQQTPSNKQQTTTTSKQQTTNISTCCSFCGSKLHEAIGPVRMHNGYRSPGLCSLILTPPKPVLMKKIKSGGPCGHEPFRVQPKTSVFKPLARLAT